MTDETDFSADDELRRQVAGADPARSLPPVDAAALASLLEDTMNRTDDEPVRRGSRGLLYGGAAAAVAGIAAAVIIGINHDTTKTPQVLATAQPITASVTALQASGVAGKCMVPTAAVVARQSFAFEGRVEVIKDGVVTFEPTKFFAGAPTDVVTVAEPDQGMSESISFQVGQTYVVGATDGEVASCLSGVASDDLLAVYDQAFPQ